MWHLNKTVKLHTHTDLIKEHIEHRQRIKNMKSHVDSFDSPMKMLPSEIQKIAKQQPLINERNRENQHLI